jgi:hypothetical protein
MSTSKSKAVATTEEENKALMVHEDYGDDAGGGFENQSSSDYAIPFIDIIQSNSPEALESDTLRPGFIFNRTTQDMYSGKEGVNFIPSRTDHCYAEWIDRDKGGGFVGRHELDSPDVLNSTTHPQKKGKKIHPTSGNDMIETFYVYGIMIDQDGNTAACVIPFTSTKIGIYRAWMTKARQQMVARQDGRKVQVPLWAHVYRLKTKLIEKNNYKWFNYEISFNGENAAACRLKADDPLYTMAKELGIAVGSGVAKADLSKQGTQTEAPQSGGSAGDTGEDIPF